jgi:hypothetical protein
MESGPSHYSALTDERLLVHFVVRVDSSKRIGPFPIRRRRAAVLVRSRSVPREPHGHAKKRREGPAGRAVRHGTQDRDRERERKRKRERERESAGGKKEGEGEQAAGGREAEEDGKKDASSSSSSSSSSSPKWMRYAPEIVRNARGVVGWLSSLTRESLTNVRPLLLLSPLLSSHPPSPSPSRIAVRSSIGRANFLRRSRPMSLG